MLFALFGITNDALNLFVNLLILSLVVVYFALVAWTYFDARRRMGDPVLVASSVGASFVFPFIGTVVYSILRPPEFLEDAHERELETRAAELRVKQLTEQSCPKCDYPVEKNFLRCPNCRARLKDPCKSCGQPVDPRWSMCPYCETLIERPVPERRAPAPEGKPAREGRSAREPQPAQQQRRAAAGSRGGGGSRGPKQPKRAAEGERRKPGSSQGAARRAPAKAGSADKSEQRQDKRETPRSASGGPSAGEERPRPAAAS